MASLFSGNPLATNVGQKIDKATDANLPSEDWASVLAVCDIINESDEGPKDAIRAIRKKIQNNVGKNYKVVLFCLTVLESCVKNCGRRFHIQVANKDFLHEFIKIIGPKNDPPQTVQEKVLSLIQTWADAFRNHPELKEIDKVYQDLKAKGIEFPMTDLDNMVPIHTPASVQPQQLPFITQIHQPPSYPPQAMPSPQHTISQPVVQRTTPLYPTQHQMSKLHGELNIVTGNIRVFSEMLTDLSPTNIDLADLELLQELNRTLRNMQQRIVELIDSVANEEVTVELLTLNDTMNNVFLRYDRFEKYRTTKPPQQPVMSPVDEQAHNDAPPPSYDQISEQYEPNVGNLIDFGDPHASQMAAQMANMNMNGESQPAKPQPTQRQAEARPTSDDFDMFAQSRQAFDSNKQSLSSDNVYRNQQVDEVRGGLGQAVNIKSNAPMTDKEILDLQEAETDYDEMEQWLKVNDPNYAASQNQMAAVTSSEFDEFLSQRSNVNDVPEISTRNVSQTRQINKEDDNNALFAL